MSRARYGLAMLAAVCVPLGAVAIADAPPAYDSPDALAVPEWRPSGPTIAPRVTWRAVVEWEHGESAIVAQGASLPDCMGALEPYDGLPAAIVTYCERESL